MSVQSSRDLEAKGLRKLADELLTKLEGGVFPCTRISLTCTNFQQVATGERGIEAFLQAPQSALKQVQPSPKPVCAESPQKSRAKRPCDAISHVDHGPEADDVDREVLAELPHSVRKEVEAQMALAAATAKAGAKAGVHMKRQKHVASTSLGASLTIKDYFAAQ